jgi:hypothetical protein
MVNIINTYWGDGEYSDRRAEVCKNNRGYYVQFFIADEVVEYREVYAHSERYAEDTAENWCLGIIDDQNY